MKFTHKSSARHRKTLSSNIQDRTRQAFRVVHATLKNGSLNRLLLFSLTRSGATTSAIAIATSVYCHAVFHCCRIFIGIHISFYIIAVTAIQDLL